MHHQINNIRSLSASRLSKMPAMCVEQGLMEKPTVQCVSTGQLLKKMKGLKKLKRKMGLGKLLLNYE